MATRSSVELTGAKQGAYEGLDGVFAGIWTPWRIRRPRRPARRRALRAPVRGFFSYKEDHVGATGAQDHCLDALRYAVMGVAGT
ncbi:hypothetical protein [Halosolutus halophilus]|uniref:hypothetical protein n=1 Tax=Halosolutus halophilus TaxID=1552990 RepID=UPI00223511B5|nr:hypothetical protein [Halosolutus halophilus]